MADTSILPNLQNFPEHMSIPQVAEALGVSQRSVNRYIHDYCSLPFFRLGPKLIRIRKTELAAWLSRQIERGSK